MSPPLSIYLKKSYHYPHVLPAEHLIVYLVSIRRKSILLNSSFELYRGRGPANNKQTSSCTRLDGNNVLHAAHNRNWKACFIFPATY